MLQGSVERIVYGALVEPAQQSGMIEGVPRQVFRQAQPTPDRVQVGARSDVGSDGAAPQRRLHALTEILNKDIQEMEVLTA